MSELKIKITNGSFSLLLSGDAQTTQSTLTKLLENQAISVCMNSPADSAFCSPCSSVIPQQRHDGNSVRNDNDNAKAARRTTKKTDSVFKMIKDQNLLRTLDGSTTLQEFAASKNPTSNIQKTAVIVYFLQNKLSIESITADHIYTCYKLLKWPIPNNLQQNLVDACSSRYGLLSKRDGGYVMSIPGDNLVEHELSRDNATE